MKFVLRNVLRRQVSGTAKSLPENVRDANLSSQIRVDE
jgi:hypothetical protein